MRKRKGFTLIELLVVIAIIGLLATLAVVALNNARAKSRDARRISDIKQIQTALELYFNDETSYPEESPAVVLGATGQTTLSSGADWSDTPSGTTYMGKVPTNPTPNGADYSYLSAAPGATYTITFTTEGVVAGGLDCTGGCTASPTGIQ